MSVGLCTHQGGEGLAKAHHGIHQQIGAAMVYSTNVILYRLFLVGAQKIGARFALVGVNNSGRTILESIELVFPLIAFVVMSYVFYGIGNVFLRSMSDVGRTHANSMAGPSVR